MPARRKPSSDTLPAAKKSALTKTSTTIGASPALVTDLRQLILSAREQAARAVDSGLILLYWSIGHRIRTDVLKEKRAEYGEKILHAVSAKLTAEFGRGYGQRNLARMVQFAEVFPDPKILTSLMTKLGWTHFLHFIREYMMRNEQGLAPTHAAFQKFFDLTPPSVNSMLIRLEQRGFIRRTPGQARGIQLIITPDLIPPLERPFKF